MPRKIIYSILVFLLIMACGISVWLFIFLNSHFIVQEDLNLDLKQVDVEQSVIADPIDESKYNNSGDFVLRQKLEDGSYKAIAKSADKNASASRWGDWLFLSATDLVFLGGDSNYKDYQILAFNLVTREKKIIFDIMKDAKELKDFNNLYFNNIIVINNDLYLEIGNDSPKIEGAIYWSELPVMNNFKELDRGSSPSIVGVNNKYWINDGYADACFSWQYYKTFDFKSKKIGPELSVSYECGMGQGVIGEKDNGDLLVAKYSKKKEEDIEGSISAIYLVDYSSLATSSLLSVDKMPPKISEAFYYRPHEKIILFGDGVYYYDLNNGEVKKINDELSHGNYYMSEWKGDNKLCFKFRNSPNNEYEKKFAVLDLEDNSIVFASSGCGKDVYFYNEVYSLRKTLKTIELPEGFEFVEE